jgi:hypothetical protein
LGRVVRINFGISFSSCAYFSVALEDSLSILFYIALCPGRMTLIDCINEFPFPMVSDYVHPVKALAGYLRQEE